MTADIHEPSGYLLVHASEPCPDPDCLSRKRSIISLDVDERMSLRVGRYLLVRCGDCVLEYLVDRG